MGTILNQYKVCLHTHIRYEVHTMVRKVYEAHTNFWYDQCGSISYQFWYDPHTLVFAVYKCPLCGEQDTYKSITGEHKSKKNAPK